MNEGSQRSVLQPEARIAIVSGSFRSGYSYQENIWAERLTARGCSVRVFCTELGHEGEVTSEGYSLKSIPVRGSRHRNLFYERAVGDEVAAFNPELILWFGPPQLFGRSLLGRSDSAPIIVFMGQNRRMQAFDWTAPGLTLRERAKAGAYRLIRGPAIAAACREASLVVANTEETPGIIQLYLPEADAQIMEKVRCFPLGYDPIAFGYDPERRARAREARQLTDETILVLISSRFVPEKAKAVNHLLDGALGALSASPHMQLAILGLGEDPLSAAVRRRCDDHPDVQRIHLFPFGDRETLSDHLHAADLALFAQPSISCQEALGAGCYGVFADDGSMDWLLATSEDGALYKTGDEAALSDAILHGISHLMGSNALLLRRGRADRAHRLNYDAIIDQIIESASNCGR